MSPGYGWRSKRKSHVRADEPLSYLDRGQLDALDVGERRRFIIGGIMFDAIKHHGRKWTMLTRTVEPDAIARLGSVRLVPRDGQ